jgi:hypothetical protein
MPLQKVREAQALVEQRSTPRREGHAFLGDRSDVLGVGGVSRCGIWSGRVDSRGVGICCAASVGEGSGTVRGRLWRYRWVVSGVVAVCAGLVVVLLAWPSGGRQLPPPRARVYSQFDACLLTDANGVSGPAAAPVWAGMQAASLKTSGKVSYLSVYGPDTVANAEPYVNTLVQRKCDMVIAVGPTEVAAVRGRAAAFPSERFVVVDSGSSSGNVATVESSSGSAVPLAVQLLVTRAAGA